MGFVIVRGRGMGAAIFESLPLPALAPPPLSFPPLNDVIFTETFLNLKFLAEIFFQLSRNNTALLS